MIFFLILPLLLAAFVLQMIFRKKKISIKNKHVVITGGSSGIGFETAIEAAKLGAHVTIIARNVENLQKSVEEIKKATVDDTQKIQYVSCDVSNYEAIKRSLEQLEEAIAPVFMLVNCAGLAISAKLEDTSVEDMEKMMNVNYLGTVYPIKSIITELKKRKEGVIVITSSMAGLIGIFGYTTYSATKFALRGFAECLDQEVKLFNISVTLAVPPDTDTPGFEIENKTKPIETKTISKGAELLQPNVVAKKLMKDALHGHFFSYVGIEGFMSTTLCSGMSPYSSLFQLLWQSMLMGPFKIISGFYLKSFYGIIEKFNK